MFLCFGSCKPILENYFDAGRIVSWQFKQQKWVASSTTEAEYITVTEVGKEMLQLERFL